MRAWLAEGAGPAWRERSPTELLEALFAASPRRWLRRMPGRETFLWEGLPGGRSGAADWVVKRYTGDAPRDAWYDRLHGRPRRSDARREYENLLQLRAAGLRVPGAEVCLEETRGRARRSAVVMERVAGEPLRARLQRRLETGLRSETRALVELVARFHGLGWYHRDLYLHQVLWPADGGPLWLLDVARARREDHPRERWRVKDLAALLASAPPRLPPRVAWRFLRDYLRARGANPRSRRSWAARVQAKSSRLRAHRPRWTDPASEIGP